MVQELQTAAEDMQKLGEAMAELFERTAQAIRTGSLLFEQADNGAAKDLEGLTAPVAGRTKGGILTR